MLVLNTNIPELVGFDTGVCLANLDVLSERHSRLSESLLAMLSELADAILQDADGDRDTMESILLSLQGVAEDGAGSPIPTGIAATNRADMALLAARAGLYPRLVLYRMIEERISKPQASPSRTASLPASARGRIAYMPSTFANKAYLSLSACVKNPRSSETAGFVDACEEVQSGLCEYCILPTENSHSGKLTAFARLMLRYSLEIVAVTDLENAAEGTVTRFALLRASHGDTPVGLSSVDTPQYWEIFHLSDTPTLSDLLAAAEFCGISLYRVDTLPLPDGEGGDTPALDCVLHATGGDLVTFRRFLSLEAPKDLSAGIYRVV